MTMTKKCIQCVLDEKSLDLTKWMEVINEQAILRFKTSELTKDTKATTFLLDNLKSFLVKTNVDEFIKYLDNPDNSFWVERINSKQSQFVEYRNSYILLDIHPTEGC